MKKILFYTDSDTGLNGEIALFNLMKMRGLEVEPYFCYTNDLHVKDQSLNYLRLEWTDQGFAQRIRNKFYMFEKNPLISYFAISAHKYEIGKMREQIKKLFDEIQPDYFFPYADRRGGYEENLIYYAKNRAIPVILPSYSGMRYFQYFANPKNGIAFDKEDKMPFIYRRAQKINPNWFKEHDGKIVCFKEATELLAEYDCKIANMNPWMVGATEPELLGYSTLEGYLEAVENLGEKIVKGRIAFCGRTEDEIVKAYALKKDDIKHMLSEKYRLKNDRIIIFSLNPAEHCGLCDEQTSLDVHKKIALALSKNENVEVLLSVHPKMSLETYLALDDVAENIHIASEPLREIVSTADSLVFADWSSLTGWAKLLEIPYFTIPKILWEEPDDDKLENHMALFREKQVKECLENTEELLDFLDLFLQLDARNDIGPILSDQFDKIIKKASV